MRRSTWPRSLSSSLGLALLLALACPARADSNRSKEDPDFAWDVVSTESQIAWRVLGRDELDKLRERYEGAFFYFRDETGRYVVTDPSLVAEAMAAPREIHKHQRVIQSLADAEARLSLANADHEDEIERLERKMRRLDREIEEMRRAGKSTDQLERTRFETSVNIQALQSLSEDNKLTKSEEDALKRQRDKAKSELREVERVIEGKVRKIAEKAKQKGLAERQP